MTYYLIDRKAKLIFPVYGMSYPQFLQSIRDLDKFRILLDIFEEYQECCSDYDKFDLVKAIAYTTLETLTRIDTFNILPILYLYQKLGTNFNHVSCDPRQVKRFMYVTDISRFEDYQFVL